MTPRAALVLSLVTGAVAVAVVAADTVLGLSARIDSRIDGEWTTIWAAPGTDRFGEYPSVHRCGEPEMRLRLENRKPWAEEVRVEVWYYNVTTGDRFLVRDTWRLDAFGARETAFTVPGDAFRPEPVPPPAPERGWAQPAYPGGREGSIQFRIGDLTDHGFLCVSRGVDA